MRRGPKARAAPPPPPSVRSLALPSRSQPLGSGIERGSPARPAAQLCGARAPCQRLATHGQPRRRVGSRLPTPAAAPAWFQGLPAPPPAAHVSATRSRPHDAVPTLRLAGGGAAGGAAAAVAAAAAPAGTCMTSGRRRPRAACFWQARRRQTSRPTTPRVATTSQCASPPRGAVPAKSATQPVRRRHACVRLRCRVLLPCACQAGWTHVSIRACAWARLWAGWAGWCHAACCCHAGRPAAGRLPISPQQLIPAALPALCFSVPACAAAFTKCLSLPSFVSLQPPASHTCWCR